MIRVLILSMILLSCTSKPKIFLLKDVGIEKYHLLDTIAKKREKGILAKAPLVAIDGIELKYKSVSDTVILPLFRKDIASITFLHQKGSHIIYGENAKEGAIIITTPARAENITTDTTHSN